MAGKATRVALVTTQKWQQTQKAEKRRGVESRTPTWAGLREGRGANLCVLSRYSFQHLNPQWRNVPALLVWVCFSPPPPPALGGSFPETLFGAAVGFPSRTSSTT